ncbi:GNAT family N-acetyltransferase [Pengzhenrongella sicca]|uniref:GNAT family N-acetyltransferase n=1 Tax=Pengzhenrongella sicca TaxID=2819238 RepID=A0A8A4ZBC2_9MICO|nr:GNAT family N-acetyltransferase [Pengzhenrongella sicca]QTE28711.1 GNAT family N-acetyltransferase [Pengzhenrongella sicca]
MADLIIRVATTPDDIAAAGALTAEAYLADGLLDPGDSYLLELRDAARRAREATVLVALLPASAPSAEPTSAAPPPAARELAGTVTLAPAGSPYAEIAEPGELEIRMLAVAPAARRQGIARALTRAALLEAVARGARRVVLSTLEPMAAAHRLYGRLGFVRVPARDWHVGAVSLRVYAREVPEGPGLRIETALWRPVEVRDVDGWRLGLSAGFTRRANSVVALAEPADVRASLDEVERVYATARQPAIFRVCAQSLPENLDEVLRSRGYRTVSRTQVMVRGDLEQLAELAELAVLGARAQLTTTEAAAPDDAWLTAWLAVKSAHPVDPAVAAAVLRGAPAAYVRARSEGRTVGVIRAAREQEWVGLSCLCVDAGARRRGLGRALTLEALRVAASRGARRAFLQVEESNEAAIALYEELGFAPAARYVYRQR